MAKTWKDPLIVTPPKNKLVEVMGIPAAAHPKSAFQFKEWRAAAFMGDDGHWYLPELTMMKWTPLLNMFFHEPYRWRDLRK